MADITDILVRLKINELNSMQNDTCDNVLNTNKDIVVISPTGSGKTLAYMLPVTQLVDVSADALQVVVILPSRELARQSAAVLESMGTSLRAVCCYGGRPAMDEHKIIKQTHPQIIFGTPGRLNDHMDKGNISPYTVRLVIIDEFDKCLEMGFHDEMSRLLSKLPGVRRRILLSATDAEQIPSFVRVDKAVRLDYSSDSIPSGISLYELRSRTKDKLDTLRSLLCTFGSKSSIVFLNYRDGVERVAEYLRANGFSVSSFHGGMDQTAREEALYKFSNGSTNVFVSTDLGSRGLDIPHVDNIIHYHLPQIKEAYIHRVGRTARWDAEGDAFFILGPDEEVPDFVEDERDTFVLPDDVPVPALPRMVTIYIGKGKKDKISKGDIVGFLCKKGGLVQTEIGRIDVRERYAYVAVLRDRHKKLLSQIQGEKIKGIKTVVEIVK